MRDNAMSVIPQSIAYKESGIPWVGKIPEHWSVVRGVFLFFNEKTLNSELQCQERLALTMSGVIERDIEKNDGLNPADFRTYQIFQQDDLVFKLIDLDNLKTSRVGYVHKMGIMSSAYIRLIPKQGVFSKFFYYQYFDLYLKHIFNFLGTGVRSTLNSDELLNIEVVLPPIYEQQAIADFLDKKTRQIEDFIEKKQKLIALLEEKKQTLINQCVTQGLDPSTPLKDSGVEWLGKIPTHWEVRKIKHFCKINPIINQEIPNYFTYIDLESVTKGSLQKKQVISKEQAPSRAQRILQKKDILFQLVRPYQKNNYLFDEDGDYVASTGYAQIRTRECEKFVYYAFLEDSLIQRVVLKCTGSNYPAITSSDFGDLKIPLPPPEEQRAIAEYLDTQIEKIDLAICKIKSQINLIKEYKTTLISEAVCGRVESIRKE